MNVSLKMYKLHIEFVEPLLGTQPRKDIATKYITDKAADADGNLPPDELETLTEQLEKATTVFHKLPDGTRIYYDYHVRGFLKEAGSVLNSLQSVKALKSKIDNYVFVEPRRIVLHMPEGAEVASCERPLRAMTMQGPRTGLAKSEQLPAGTWMDCVITVLAPKLITEPLLRTMLDYGAYKGFGQWRNSGMGRFKYVLEAVADES